jgi:hypothetical protein
MKRFILINEDMNEYKEKTMYTWNKNWILPFESPWSILQKFQYTNVLRDTDIFKTLGGERIRKKKSPLWSQMDRKLIDLNAFDDDRSKAILNISIKELNDQHYSRLLGSENLNLVYTYFDRELRYCPECLKNGYHSILHQFKLFELCSVHNQAIQNQCPSCHSTIPYELNEKHFKEPFQCKCGHSFIEKDYLFKLLSFATELKEQNIKFKNKEIKKWMSLTDAKRNQLKTIYFSRELLDEQSGESKNNSILKNFLTAIEASENCKSVQTPKIYTINKSNSINRCYKDAFFYDKNKEIYFSTVAIYKSIARHIRNQLIKEHKDCIKRLNRRVADPKFCPFALAYLQWKQFVQGVEDFTHVDKYKREPGLDFLSPQFISDQDEELLDDILFQARIITGEDIIRNKFPLALWLMNQTIATLLLNHFCMWLELSYKTAEKGQYYARQPKELEKPPFFLIFFSNEFVLFHKWGSRIKTISNLDHSKCPFYGLKKKPVIHGEWYTEMELRAKEGMKKLDEKRSK